MITLQLADVPFDADVANPQGRPLGTRAQVATRFADLLPGTSFDENGRGVFQRGAYQIAFMMYGDPPTSIGVAFKEAEAFTAMARIVEKTGWCLLDPEAKGFVDLPASRAAGRTVLVGDEVPVAPAAATSTLSALRSAAPKSRLLLAAMAGLVIAGTAVAAMYLTGNRMSTRLTAILATQSSSTRFEKYPDRLVRRKQRMATLPAPYDTDKIVEQLLDAQMASRAYLTFVDGRFTSPALLSNEAIWSRFQMPAFLPATFALPQRDGYEFEFRGEGCEESEPGWPECSGYAYIASPLNRTDGRGVVYALFAGDDTIHVRTDGRVPTKADPGIDGQALMTSR